MSTQASKDRPRVGVFSRTRNIAAVLAQDMSIANPVLLSPESEAHRGAQLKGIVIDAEMWPLTRDQYANYLPCLKAHAGYLIKARRIDPTRETLPVRGENNHTTTPTTQGVSVP